LVAVDAFEHKTVKPVQRPEVALAGQVAVLVFGGVVGLGTLVDGLKKFLPSLYFGSGCGFRGRILHGVSPVSIEHRELGRIR